MPRNVRKYFSTFVNGLSYAGDTEELTLPKLVMKMEEWRAGGMNAPMEVNVGMEKMESDFSMLAYDPNILGLFGVAVGQQTPFTFREVLESDGDGTVTGVVHTLRGRIKEIDQGTVKPGEKVAIKTSIAVDYYKLQHGATVVHEIDVVNMIHVVNGVDILAAQRSALGM